MKPEDFEKKMERLCTPKSEVLPPKELRLAILNSQRSAVLGFWLIVVPWFFLMCVIIKYFFHIDLGIIATFEEIMSSLDRNPKTWWIGPTFFMALPIISVVINALAVSHFKWEPNTSLMVVSIRMKWLNLMVLMLGAGIVGIFFLYLITENCH